MDYEHGLDILKKAAEGTDWYKDFALQEAALRENISNERRFGSSPQTHHDRFRIIYELNDLSLKYLNISFNDLCLGKAIPHQTQPVQQQSQITASKPSRTSAFVSYSHKDKKYLDELRIHLAPYVRMGIVDLWDDTKITAGARWQEEIEKALLRAKVAVLLVSADFLASDFIAKNELPPLLTAASEEGTVILPVILRPCLFKDTELAQFQAANAPSNPLSKMTRAQREEMWIQVAQVIKNTLNLAP